MTLIKMIWLAVLREKKPDVLSLLLIYNIYMAHTYIYILKQKYSVHLLLYAFVLKSNFSNTQFYDVFFLVHKSDSDLIFSLLSTINIIHTVLGKQKSSLCNPVNVLSHLIHCLNECRSSVLQK